MIGRAGELHSLDERTRSDEARVLDLREEELLARKQWVEAGEVEIRKEVVTETQVIEVPVKRERVIVKRRTRDQALAEPGLERGDGEMPRRLEPGETIRIPVVQEEVVVQKRPIVVEEVVVAKRVAQETRRVAEYVDREEPVVRTKGQVHLSGNLKKRGAQVAASIRPARPAAPASPLALGLASLAAVGSGVGLGWLYRRIRHLS